MGDLSSTSLTCLQLVCNFPDLQKFWNFQLSWVVYGRFCIWARSYLFAEDDIVVADLVLYIANSVNTYDIKKTVKTASLLGSQLFAEATPARCLYDIASGFRSGRFTKAQKRKFFYAMTAQKSY